MQKPRKTYKKEYCEEIGRGIFYATEVIGGDEEEPREKSVIAELVKNDFPNLVKIIKSYYWPKVELAEEFINTMMDAVQKKSSDQAIYELLKEYHSMIVGFKKDEKERAEAKAKSIISALDKAGIEITSDADYLDYGCFDGSITLEVAKQLGIDKKNAHGADVIKYLDYDFDFKLIQNEYLPFDDESFDVMTIIMTMHHITGNIGIFIKEVDRVLKDGGILIVREHDVSEKQELAAKLLFIQHALFDYVWSDKTWNIASIEEHAHYKTADEWRELIEDESRLKLLWPRSRRITSNSPLAKFTHIYMKQA